MGIVVSQLTVHRNLFQKSLALPFRGLVPAFSPGDRKAKQGRSVQSISQAKHRNISLPLTQKSGSHLHEVALSRPVF